GMDFPEGARVTNISINLGILGKDDVIHPPIEVYSRTIDESIIRITSTDLAESKDIKDLDELFNFANDHLGLLKAGIVASGLIPPSLKGEKNELEEILAKLLGKKGGFELVTKVSGIPKGSRLAVSTSLLACIITNCMRFSGQLENIEGIITDDERRLVASRAILGEWLGGSGGGWQDSGSIWPGIKVITGKLAKDGDPEFNISRGCLLPTHEILSKETCIADIEERLASSIILVHGGMAQDVGPILEMVTEKYLLRLSREWDARKKGFDIFDKIVEAIKKGNIKEMGRLTSLNFDTCITPIIPWVTNSFTEEIRSYLENKYVEDFWGFLMLGGMTGGGMAYIVNPSRKNEILEDLKSVLKSKKDKYSQAIPFAMDPVIYMFSVNHDGIIAHLKEGKDVLMPDEYYKFKIMQILVSDKKIKTNIDPDIQCFIKAFGNISPVEVTREGLKRFYKVKFLIDIDDLRISLRGENPKWERAAEKIKSENGFDPAAHEEMKADVKAGRISIKGNRFSLTTKIEDVREEDVILLPSEYEDRSTFKDMINIGTNILDNREVAVVSLAAGLGSRWTSGAGVVKTLNPFVKIAGKHRSFAEIHLAKTKKTSRGRKPIQHVFTTSFLTHDAIKKHIEDSSNFGFQGSVYLSRAHAIGQRLHPTERDLRFIWDELPQQISSENVQRVIYDLHETLIRWAKESGEGEDYVANEPIQRFYPPGHWFEIPNMLRNGTLAKMITENPSLKYLFVHNGDTLGAWLDPLVLGLHENSGKMLSFEVTPRRFEDRGGGLATVNGKLCLIEGLALPSEEDEYRLSYYNTLTSTLTIDKFLQLFDLTRDDLLSAQKSQKSKDKIHQNLRKVESFLPTYATIKDVKLRWGAGHEDVFPSLQCEKLWGDVTTLDGVTVQYLAVHRFRGQQMKEPEQLDRWAMDGSKEHIVSLTDF
ncbi:UTP--glucose-1-phosphate uridylyltransferase, partial [bacterium]|nr:UTP--glucose-1-phosphate uridylyltransferase [bacterium]